jgi:hypothetical protein
MMQPSLMAVADILQLCIKNQTVLVGGFDEVVYG